MGGAPSIANIFRTSLVVGVGDVAAVNNPEFTLSTYALGSCVALVLFDPLIKAGGLLHCVLPDSSINPQKAYSTPGMFADTGFAHLLSSLESFGSKRSRLRSFLAGGASTMGPNEPFRIGDRNTAAITQLMLQHRIAINIQQTGGIENRSVFFHLKNGLIEIKMSSGKQEFML